MPVQVRTLLVTMAALLVLPAAAANPEPPGEARTYTFSGHIPADFRFIGDTAPDTSVISDAFGIEGAGYAVPDIPVPANAQGVLVELTWAAEAPTDLRALVTTDWSPCHASDFPIVDHAFATAHCAAAGATGSSDPERGAFADETGRNPSTGGTSSLYIPGEAIAEWSTCKDVCTWTARPWAATPGVLATYEMTVTVFT